jgi:hypothetical protein
VRAISGLWRWRRNPLCRATDLAEAWLALVALLLVLLVAPVAGMLVGGEAEESLQRSVRDQHETRHLVRAFVIRRLAGPSWTPTRRRVREGTCAAASSPAGPRRTAPRTAAPSRPVSQTRTRATASRYGPTGTGGW